MTTEKEISDEADIELRDVMERDLPIFFQQQLDHAANHMAAFTAVNPADKSAFGAHWAAVLRDEENTNKTIIVDSAVRGKAASAIVFVCNKELPAIVP